MDSGQINVSQKMPTSTIMGTPFVVAGGPPTQLTFPVPVYTAVTTGHQAVPAMNSIRILTPPVYQPPQAMLPPLQDQQSTIIALASLLQHFSPNTQKNSVALINLTQKIQLALSNAETQQHFDEHEAKLLQEISNSLLPSVFTVPICQDWNNFIGTFNGNVKVTTNPFLKTSKFKFEFFQQIAHYYFLKNFLDIKKSPIASPTLSDELNLNLISYTDRMDIIIGSILNVLQDMFQDRCNALNTRNVSLQKELQQAQKQIETLKNGSGLAYLYPSVESGAASRKRSAQTFDEGGRTIYKVMYIGTFDVDINGTPFNGEKIFKMMTQLKEKMKGESSTNPSAMSLNDEEIAIHIAKQSPKIQFSRVACICVDGLDRNFFCVGHGIAPEAVLRTYMFCTNTQSTTSDIVQLLHKKTLAKRPQGSGDPVVHFQRIVS